MTPALGLIALTTACELTITPLPEPPPIIEAAVEPGYPQLDAPCRGPNPAPTHLVVTSTDFNTGAVGLVDLGSRRVTPDLALASSDAIPFVIDDAGRERVFIVNRFGFDYVDELDPRAELALLHQLAITPATVAAPANPQSIILDRQGQAWVSLFGAGELHRIVFPTVDGDRPRATAALDLRRFADADGIPELSRMIRCGDQLFVGAERLDRRTWTPVDGALLIPVRLPREPGDAPTLFDFDDAAPGPDAIHLRGVGTGSWRLDPSDPNQHTILALNSGIERIDLASGTSEWLVDEQLFADAGYGRLQLSGFGLDASGRIWVSAATPDYAEFRLLRVDRSGLEPELVVEFDGLQSVTGALEIIGHEAWFADTTIGASGLRVFDLAAHAVSEAPDSPLAVGLPPMSLAPLSL